MEKKKQQKNQSEKIFQLSIFSSLFPTGCCSSKTYPIRTSEILSPLQTLMQVVQGAVHWWSRVGREQSQPPQRPGHTHDTPRATPCPQRGKQACAAFQTLHSPLSSQDSDWKELRDCTSDRLSRALYGCEGFSSRGFLDRQGSRSTTLAKRKRTMVSSRRVRPPLGSLLCPHTGQAHPNAA